MDFIHEYTTAKNELIRKARLGLLNHFSEMFDKCPAVTAVGWVQYNPNDCWDAVPQVSDFKFTALKDFSNVDFSQDSDDIVNLAESIPGVNNITLNIFDKGYSSSFDNMLLDIFGFEEGVQITIDREGNIVVSDYEYVID